MPSVRGHTGGRRSGTDIRDVIADLDPVPRGRRGNYLRTGNAARGFTRVDDYDDHVVRRPRGPLTRKRGIKKRGTKKRGRDLPAGQSEVRTEEWFHGLGLYRDRPCPRTGRVAPSAIRRPRNPVKETIGKPCVGKPPNARTA